MAWTVSLKCGVLPTLAGNERVPVLVLGGRSADPDLGVFESRIVALNARFRTSKGNH